MGRFFKRDVNQNGTVLILVIAYSIFVNGSYILSKSRYNVADTIIAKEFSQTSSVDDLLRSERLSFRLDTEAVNINGLNSAFMRASSLWQMLEGQEIENDLLKSEIALLLFQKGIILQNKSFSEAALSWFEAAAVANQEWADPLFMMGAMYQKDKRMDEALDAYETALSRSSFHFIQKGDIYLKSSEIHTASGRRQQAYSDLREANRHRFSNQTVHAHALYSLAMEQWYFQEPKSNILITLKEAVELNPQHYWAWYTLGRLYLDDHLFVEATSATEKAIQIEPQNVAAYLVLAQIYENSSELLMACQIYESILQLAPKDEASIQKYSQCKRLGLN